MKSYTHRCAICRKRFTRQRPWITCGSTCRAERSRKRTGRDTRTSGKGKALRSAPASRKRRRGKRADTEYVVLRLTRGKYAPVGSCKAHDRETAIRRIASGGRGIFIAVPVRQMAPLDEEGHHASP